MATRNVNLMNAIDTRTTRTARATTSVIRVGRVVGKPAGGTVTVNIGGKATPCNYLDGDYPTDGMQVAVLVTADVWIVIGCPATNDRSGKTPYYYAYGDTVMPSTTTAQVMPINKHVAPVAFAHLDGGNIVIDQDGVYLFNIEAQYYTREATTAVAAAYGNLNLSTGGVVAWSASRGAATFPTWVHSGNTLALTAGTWMWYTQSTAGAVANSTCNYIKVIITQLSRA